MADIPPGVNVFESNQSTLYAATFATFSLAAAAVVLRFGSRWLTRTHQGWDDWLALLALALSFLLTIDVVMWTQSGFGRHYELYGTSIFPPFFRFLMFADMAYAAIQAVAKAAVLAFYLRLFPDEVQLRQRVPVLALFLASWLVAALITAALECMPDGPQCGIGSRGYPVGIWLPNMLANVAVLLLPLPYMSVRRMTRTQRTLMYGVFGSAALVCAVSTLRFLIILGQDGADLDFTWNLVPLGVWTLVESNLTIVVACLPAFSSIWASASRFPNNSRCTSLMPTPTVEKAPRPAWMDDAADPLDAPLMTPDDFAFRDSEDLADVEAAFVFEDVPKQRSGL